MKAAKLLGNRPPVISVFTVPVPGPDGVGVKVAFVDDVVHRIRIQLVELLHIEWVVPKSMTV